MTGPRIDAPEWFTPGQFAALVDRDVRTVTRWDQQGRFPEGMVIRTPSGQRRFCADAVRMVLAGPEDVARLEQDLEHLHRIIHILVTRGFGGQAVILGSEMAAAARAWLTATPRAGGGLVVKAR